MKNYPCNRTYRIYKLIQSSGYIPINRKIKPSFHWTQIFYVLEKKKNTEVSLLQFADVKFELIKILATTISWCSIWID